MTIVDKERDRVRVLHAVAREVLVIVRAQEVQHDRLIRADQVDPDQAR